MKGRRPLALPVVGRLGDLIAKRWEACTPDGYVFMRIGKRRFSRTWQAATAAVGLPGLILHDLRRSGARTLIRAGVPEDTSGCPHSVHELGNSRYSHSHSAVRRPSRSRALGAPRVLAYLTSPG
jgi:hypothetical protein